MNIQEASSAFQKGNFKQSIAILTKLLEKESNKVQFIALRGLSFRKEKMYEDALKDFNKALTIEPNNADLHSEKGVTLFHMHNALEALTSMNKAVEIEPNNPYRYSSRAYIKDALKDIDGAIEDYHKAIELDPEDAIALNNLGMLEEKKGNIKKANQHFDDSDKIQGVDYSKIDFNKEAQKNGGSSISKEDAKKEVIGLSQLQKKSENETKTMDDVIVQEAPKKTAWQIIVDVFTKKDVFNEFLAFIGGLFKSKKSN